MATTVKQKEEQTNKAVSVQVTEAEIADKVDAYGSAAAELKARLEELKPLEKLVAELAKGLVAEGNDWAADDVMPLTGVSEYNVELSKKSMSVVEVNKKLLRKTLGKDTFYELANIGVGDIRKYCTPPQIEKILTEERTGKRRITVTKKL